MNPDKVVFETIQAIVRRKNASGVDIKPEDHITEELGFGSLDMAELVATLEMKLGFDPFADGASIASVRTVADIVALYTKGG